MGKKNLPKISIRYTSPEDRTKILSILRETNFFRPQELMVAEEVLDDALAKGPQGHYQSFVAEDGRDIVGWICFGPTPCTVGTFDIYWIVVAPGKQRCGIGACLMQYATDIIKKRNGRMIIAETSGSERYLSTRRFYEKMNYRRACCVENFYALGDDKVIYVKLVNESQGV
jgi:ribosomal protein S18 acetylase RimI-like enzyme